MTMQINIKSGFIHICYLSEKTAKAILLEADNP